VFEHLIDIAGVQSSQHAVQCGVELDLPQTSPDTLAGVTVIALDFDDAPEYIWVATTPALTA